MNLIVDIGNSRIKMAVMEEYTVVKSIVMDNYCEKTTKEFISKYDISHSLVSSTRGEQSGVVESLRAIVGHCMLFEAQSRVPLKISYLTPQTLGRDRLAAAVGAREMYGDGDMLIVDFGTAITIDYISRAGGFEGGVISAGVGMRFRALHEFTASLPLCAATEEVKGIARTTNEAIEQGVMRGVCMEVEGHISYFLGKCEKLSVIFIGGDAKFFEKRIKNAIFANQELLFVGLNRILNYNAK